MPTIVLTGATSGIGLAAGAVAGPAAGHPRPAVPRLPEDAAHAMFGGGGAGAERGGANVAAATTVSAPSGSYLDERVIGSPNPVALDPLVQAALHERTDRLLGRSTV